MYIYFDSNGYLKEFINDPKREGSQNVNKLYIYIEPSVEDVQDKVIDHQIVKVWMLLNTYPSGTADFRLMNLLNHVTDDDGNILNTLSFNFEEDTVYEAIPYNKDRDLKYFVYGRYYQFIKLTIPSEVLLGSGEVACSLSLVDPETSPEDQYRFVLDVFTFIVQESVIKKNINITQAEYAYLLSTKIGISNTSLVVSELPETGQNNVFYVLKGENTDNIYIWNGTSYVWVGSNKLSLANYYTKTQGDEFENDINSTVGELKNQLQSVASGSPKGVYSTLSALQTADPNHQYIYVISGTDEHNGHWYYWNGSAWTDGGVYQSTGVGVGEIIYSNLADSLKDAYVKKFVDNPEKLTLNKYQNYNNSGTDSYNGMTIVELAVKPGMKLKYGFTLVTPDVRGLAFFNSSNNYISGVQSSTTTQTITVPVGAVKCKATIHSGNYYEIQIILDAFDIVSNSVDQEKEITKIKTDTQTLGVQTGNLFDGDTYSDGYYNNAGSIVSSTTYHNITIPVVEGDIIRAKYDTADLYNQNGCLFYDDTFVSANRYNETLVDDTYYEITVPSGVNNIRLNFKNVNGYVVIKNSPYNPNVLYGKIYMPTLDVDKQIENYLENERVAYKDDVEYAKIFRKVACIGDSITEGYYGDSGGVVYGTYPKYCYPSFLAKLINGEVKNLGLSGRTAKTWYEQYASHFSADDVNWMNYDAVVIFLGTNGGLDGEIDPDDNSMMGYYCKIIEMLLTANPQISIFLCTSPWTQNKQILYPNLDNEVIACGSHYSLPVLRLDQSSLLTYDQRLINQPYDHVLHFGRVGLMRIANEVFRCINDNGKSNPSYFNKLYGTHY